MGVTTELSEWILKASYSDLPDETVEFTKGLLLKTIAAMVVGSREPLGKKIIAYQSRMGGLPEVGVVGAGFRTSVESAAFANGVLAHAPEMEDVHFFPNNEAVGTVWMFPAILSLGEKLLSSGKEIIEASVISFEVAGRLGQAAPGIGIRRGINTATWFGALGTTAAAARLLGLSIEQTENALSIAAAQCAGLGDQTGYNAHTLEAGYSCRAGVLSAFLAEAGANGLPDIVGEGRRLFAPVGEDGVIDLTKVTNGLGKPPFDVHNIEFKKYIGCGYLHPSVDALMMLVNEQNINYEDVERVEAEVVPFHALVCDRPVPETFAAARFSFQFLLAEVLLRGKVDYSTFQTEAKLFDPKFREAESKVKLIVREDLPEGYKGARVTVIKKNGRKLVKDLKAFLGHPKNPLTLEQIRDVCRPYLDIVLREGQRNRVEELTLNMEKLADIRELMNILTFFTNPAV
jgi:2-methylcitrate dehydratase PrpD